MYVKKGLEMIKKMGYLSLSISTICFAPKQIKFEDRQLYKLEIEQRYSDEIARLQSLCAQKYYQKMVADGQPSAEAVARAHFGDNWQAAIQQTIDRNNPDIVYDSALFRSLVWTSAKNQFVDRMIKKGPGVGDWFLSSGKWSDCFIDSEAETEEEDSVQSSDEDQEDVVIYKISKKIARKMGNDIALVLGYPREERKSLKNMIQVLLKNEFSKILNESHELSGEEIGGFMNSMRILRQLNIPANQIARVQERLDLLPEMLDGESEEYSSQSDEDSLQSDE